MPNSEQDNRLRWDGRTPGFYEVYYLKANDPARGIALWLRYTLLAPQRGDPVAELWGFFFDRNHPDQNLALKATYPWSEARVEPTPFRFAIGPAVLTHTGAQGEIVQNGRRLRWDLRWAPNPATVYLLPFRWMYRGPFPRTKVLSPNFDIRLHGVLEADDQRYPLVGAPGQQAHLWGTRYAERWIWGHCNAFTEGTEVAWEGLSAQVALGPLRLPMLTLFVLRMGNQWIFLNGLGALVRNRSSGAVGTWRFIGYGPGLRIVGEAKVAPEHLVGAIYTDPDGSRRWCHNTKVGDLTLTIHPRSGGAWRPMTLTALGTCALEWVGRTQDPRVAIWV
ncbi:MAG: tocopherol cyclase family protein [Thermoflexus sp.]